MALTLQQQQQQQQQEEECPVIVCWPCRAVGVEHDCGGGSRHSRTGHWLERFADVVVQRSDVILDGTNLVSWRELYSSSSSSSRTARSLHGGAAEQWREREQGLKDQPQLQHAGGLGFRELAVRNYKQ
jgi:hypothetical protein